MIYPPSREFSIWESGEIKLNGDTIKEIPEEIREVVSCLTQGGKYTIEAILYENNLFCLRVNGITSPKSQQKESLREYLKSFF